MRIVFWSFFIWLFVRVFIFQTFQIHTASMHQTLLEGDYIIVNKLAYGARIPITPLSLSFGNEHLFIDWLHLPYMRLPGYSSVKRSDVIVFNYPMDDEFPIDEGQQYVKRCVGVPGDSISIVKGKVMINRKELQETENTLFSYNITTAGKVDTNSIKELDGYIPENSIPGNKFNYFLTKKNVDSLRHVKNILSVEKNNIDSVSYSPQIFPNSSTIKFNIDYFGPLYIPKCGGSILLNSRNLTLYKRIVEKYENNTLEIKNDSAFINGKYAQI